MKKIALFAVLELLFMTGCIPIRNNSTTHYVVLGIGIVSVNNTNQSMAQVTKSTIVGGYASEYGGGIGISTHNKIMINTNQNLVIEANSVPFKNIKVNVQ
ncbi:MAG TPA: hypothetical protein PL028_03800 [Bacteroidales bacterium]|nr:hypothetical protein [Bacteroidales bacterium]